MTTFKRRTGKYNVTLPKLMKYIISMPEDQQQALLRQLEESQQQGQGVCQRRHPRKTCKLTVDYATSGRAFSDYVQDVSTGGMFIETRDNFTAGQEMVLAFSFFKHQRPFKISGKVAWCGPTGIGVKFNNLSQLQENIIAATLEKLD
jgi:uncharacterized protein (TIGR02266 family)